MATHKLKPFNNGFKKIVDMNNKECRTKMDFGLIRLEAGQTEKISENKETALLVMSGEVLLLWDGQIANAGRSSIWEENPWCLDIPSGMETLITCMSDKAEVAVVKTLNETKFAPKLYTPQDCSSKNRGEGTMKETSTRIVRTVFDYNNAPWSNLVLGEVITFPGKWSSYPPHHHKQPEIYHYRFYPENGYGICQLGDEACVVKNGDTVEIVMDENHPQAAAPGYAMYYIWAIRHQDNDPYITPVFEKEHLWVNSPEANIWPDK